MVYLILCIMQDRFFNLWHKYLKSGSMLHSVDQLSSRSAILLNNCLYYYITS